jgi:DNA replication protein DnaC
MEVIKRAEQDERGLDWINDVLSCPVRFKDATPDKMDKKVQALFDKISIYSDSIYLHGNIGAGKTYAAYAIAKLLYVNKIDVKIRNYIDMLNEIKKSFNTEYSDDVINSLLFENKVLILDDLGSEKLTDWSVEILYRLINRRYENIMPLIIVSNLTLKELSKKYGDRITSRITEMVGDNIIKFTGKDRRLRK